MEESSLHLLRMGAFALALVLAVTLQFLRPHTKRAGSLRVNGGLWAVDLALTATICGACACTVGRWAADHGVGALNTAAVPPWIAVPVTVIALDLVSYLWHRANHVVPTLWRLHRVHHSDVTFTVSTAFRFHPAELVLSLPFRLLAVAALGAPPLGVVVFEGLFTLSNLVEHGDIDVPLRFERVAGSLFIMPAVHRFHHTREGLERDHNFGTILALWDRAFGTYRPSSSAARIDVGLSELREPIGLRAALLLPFTRLEAS
jgi:sterol desaturase/sphingolipid hydroxylase (fatty acid hydroxylase superfamily)